MSQLITKGLLSAKIIIQGFFGQEVTTFFREVLTQESAIILVNTQVSVIALVETQESPITLIKTQSAKIA